MFSVFPCGSRQLGALAATLDIPVGGVETEKTRTANAQLYVNPNGVLAEDPVFRQTMFRDREKRAGRRSLEETAATRRVTEDTEAGDPLLSTLRQKQLRAVQDARDESADGREDDDVIRKVCGGSVRPAPIAPF